MTLAQLKQELKDFYTDCNCNNNKLKKMADLYRIKRKRALKAYDLGFKLYIRGNKSWSI